MIRSEASPSVGYDGDEQGRVALRGDAKRLFALLDSMFLRIATARGARELDAGVFSSADPGMTSERVAFELRRGELLRRPERWTLRVDRRREIVLMGTPDEIRTILCGYESELERLQLELALRGSWRESSDSSRIRPLFARPPRDYLCDGVALVSVHGHGCALGKEFDVRTPRGPAHSLCISLDLERWLLAVHGRWGFHRPDWPRPLRRELAQ